MEKRNKIIPEPQADDDLQMFRFSIEQAGEAVFWMDRDARFTYVNDQACRSLGYSRAELMRLCLWDIDTIFPKERWDATWTTYENKGHCSTEVVESLHRRKDGTCFPVEVMAKHISFGKTEFHVAFVRDITDRKQTEEALYRSDERLRQAIRVSHIGIVDHDHANNTIYWSPQLREIYGWNTDEPVTLPKILECIYPGDREKIATAIRMAHDPAGNGKFDTEHRIVHRDGAVRWLTIRSQTFFEGEGLARHPVRTVGAVQDITGQKQLEEELRFTQSAIDVASIACFWVSREARLCYVNQQACTSMGYTREELLSMTVMDIDPEFTLEMWEKFWQAHSQHKVQTFESVHKRKDGSRFPVEITTNYLSYGGREYSCAYVRDTTRRKQSEKEKGELELQLAQAQKMESVGRLAGGVAHDFNNMLGVILGYLELLKGALVHDNSLYTHLQEMEKAAMRSKDITRQLLAFSRKQIIAPKAVNLNDLIWDTRKTLARLIGEHIDLRFAPQHDLWTIKVDPTQIDQILVNLCVNARDAMPDGGILAIETGNEIIDGDFCRQHAGIRPGPYVLLTVSDTGTGMDQNTLPHIFEPFFTTKDVDKGTGLGLATVYGIVKQNNGYIYVSSTPEKGTIFSIYLPRLLTAEKSGAVTEEAAPIHAGAGTIMLVEDDDMLRRITMVMLQKIGYTVITPLTPMEALRQFTQEPSRCDLLLTDVVMPEMSGAELARRIAALRPDARILFMSGYTSDYIVQHGVLGEGIHFIQKPFNMNELARKVREILGK